MDQNHLPFLGTPLPTAGLSSLGGGPVFSPLLKTPRTSRTHHNSQGLKSHRPPKTIETFKTITTVLRLLLSCFSGRGGTQAGNSFFKYLIALPLVVACGSSGSGSNTDPAPNIVNPPARNSTVTMLSAQEPNGKGGYFALGPTDFLNGHYDTDILVKTPPPLLTGVQEETTAAASGIFLTMPGFLWSLSPPSPVTVTLTAAGNSQTIKRDATTSGKLAVSLLSFPSVFPPAFRQRYDIVIASLPGAPLPFSYTFTFNIARSDAAAVDAKVLPGDGPLKLVLGAATPGFNLGHIVPTVDGCTTCLIQVGAVTLTATVKNFAELPAIPFPGDLRLSFPKRFTALLSKITTTALTPTIVNNSTGNVAINVDVPASLTTVVQWCAAKTNPPGVCTVKRLGQAVPSYYRFVNAVPLDLVEQSLGGTGGVASVVISGTVAVTVIRDGVTLETKTVTVDSGTATPLDSPILPNWVLDDLRNALTTGAAEFKL